jgi:hypothetical protein
MSEPGAETDEAKSSAFSTRVAAMSPGLIAGVLVLVLIIGAVAGYGLASLTDDDGTARSNRRGNRSGQQRNNGTRPQNNANAPKGPAVTPLTGTVQRMRSSSLTIDTPGPKRIVRTNRSTAYRRTTAGSVADLTKGTRVFYKGPNLGTAQEVLILPPNRRGGLAVVSATPTEMTVLTPARKTVKVKIQGAPIDKVASARRSDVSRNTKVVVLGAKQGSRFTAYDVVVLPPTSAFA